MTGVFRRWLTACANLGAAIALFTAMLLGALWAVVMTEHDAEREAIVASAVTQNTNLAVAYEEHVVRTLKGLDGALLFIRHEYLRLGSKLDVGRYIADGVIDGRLFNIISIVDEHGGVVLSSQGVETVNYADREFFRFHQQQRDQDVFYISAPVMGRVSKTWQVPVSRRIIKPDGSFGGVIVLSVDPDYLARFYQKVNIGEQGLVMLIGTDGVVRARRVGKLLSFGDDLTGTSLMKEHARKEVGEFLSRGGVDGVSRYVSFRKLSGYPLLVVVGAGQEEVLADFNHGSIRDFALATLVSAVIAVFAGMLIVTLGRQRRDGAALAISETRFRATFEQAAIGIVHTSLDRTYLEVNQRFCEMVGYPRDEIIGQSVNAFTHPDDREDNGRYRQLLLSGAASSLSAEKRYVRKDGELIWVNRTVSLVQDPEGRPLYFMRVVVDITERKRLEEELRELAATDVLTGLPNRRAFIARLEEEHARLKRYDAQQAAVLMLDLDYFKRVNDTWGHPAGDAVLRQVAAVINEQIRAVDMCARLGGEEFAVLLTGAAPSAAREFAERLRSKVAQTAVCYENKDISITVSVGVAALRAADDGADVALLRADRALYQAKELGRDRVEVVTAEA